ncbi:MAG: ABC transporter transmembrane domain-containing protein [Pseudomonadota bacterium]
MIDNIKLYLKYMKRLKGLYFYLSFALIIDGFLAVKDLFLPLLTKITFDYVYPFRDLYLLNVVILTTIILYFIEFYFAVVADYSDIYVDQKLNYNLVSDLFNKIQHIPLKFHQEMKSGDLLVRLTSDVDKVVSKITSMGPELILNIFKLIALLVITFSMNSKITILALCSIPFYIIETKFFSGKLQKVEQDVVETNAVIYENFQEKLRNIKTIKSFIKEKTETEKVQKHLKRKFTLSLKEKLITVVSVFANSITLKLWTVFINWYMAFLVLNGGLTVGEVVALNAYLFGLSIPISNLSGLYTSFKISLVAFKRVDDIFKIDDEKIDEGNKIIDNKSGIEFHNVSFGYEDNLKIIQNIMFNMPSNSMIALVGESGSGKSTLMDLLFRFYDDFDGSIIFGKQNIKEIKLLELREEIGLVLQEYSLFGGSIKENLLYGNENASDEDIERALKLAGAYHFVQKLTGGIHYDIGANGCNLSGGQRQRVAIARVIIKDPKIIIFDEATSALDPESDFHIQQTINELRKTKLIFMISHNLATIKKADQILYLDKGTIAEHGTFNELLKKKDKFYRFYLRQFGGFENFKNRLDIEFERVGRYGRPITLIAISLINFDEFINDFGEDFTESVIRNLDFKIQGFIRLTDFGSHFEKNTYFVTLPEISSDQTKQFLARFKTTFKDCTFHFQDREKTIEFATSCIHYNSKSLKVSEDLMDQALTNLEGLSAWEFKIKEIIT